MADNEKAMDKYGHAWRVGDMSLCLTVLVAASSVEETITFKMCSTHHSGLKWGGQVGGIPNLALNSIVLVLVHLNVHQ